MIHDIFEHAEKQRQSGDEKAHLSAHISTATLKKRLEGEKEVEKGSLFAAISARLFFFMLLITDFIWGVYHLTLSLFFLLARALLLFKAPLFKRAQARSYLNLKRSAILLLALLVALFSPALGTMVACSYFLMYDKKGVEEVVPSILHEQFEEFFESVK